MYPKNKNDTCHWITVVIIIGDLLGMYQGTYNIMLYIIIIYI